MRVYRAIVVRSDRNYVRRYHAHRIIAHFVSANAKASAVHRNVRASLSTRIKKEAKRRMLKEEFQEALRRKKRKRQSCRFSTIGKSFVISIILFDFTDETNKRELPARTIRNRR